MKKHFPKIFKKFQKNFKKIVKNQNFSKIKNARHMLLYTTKNQHTNLHH